MKMRIPIKKYVMDSTLSWEERYKQLVTHHTEETKFLIGAIEELEKSTEQAELYNHGRKDMRERVVEKLKEELLYLRGMQNSESNVELLEHLISRIQKLG